MSTYCRWHPLAVHAAALSGKHCLRETDLCQIGGGKTIQNRLYAVCSMYAVMCGKWLLAPLSTCTNPKALAVLLPFVSENREVACSHRPWKKVHRAWPLHVTGRVFWPPWNWEAFPPLLWNRGSSFWCLSNQQLPGDFVFTLMLSGHHQLKTPLSRVAWQDSLGVHLVGWALWFPP